MLQVSLEPRDKNVSSLYMDPIALIALAGVAFVAKKFNKRETYASGALADRADYSDSVNHVTKLKTLTGETRVPRGQLTISPPDFPQKQGIPGFMKKANLGFNPGGNQGGAIQYIGPDSTPKPLGLTSDDYRQIGQRYVGLQKVVANNQNPNGLARQVGRSLKGDPNVPASDGFHSGMQRILEPNPNDQRLNGSLNIPLPEGAGKRLVPTGALVSNNGITSPPDLTRWARKETNTSYTGTVGGGQFYAATPDSLYIKGNMPTLKDQTLVPQMKNMNMASPAKAPQAGVNPVGSENYQTGNPNVNTNYTRWMSNRGTGRAEMSPGLSATYTPYIGELTTVIYDNVGIHQGNPQYAGNQYVNTPTITKYAKLKGSSNPRGPDNSFQMAAKNNPYVIPSFSQLQ